MNYLFNVDLSDIPQKDGFYSWKNSVGYKIKFNSEVLNGELIIEKYFTDNYGNIKLILSYKGKCLPSIGINQIKHGKLNAILKNEIASTFKHQYNIGDTFKSDDYDYVITDIKQFNYKWKYKVKCNVCGCDCGKHYSILTKTYRDEVYIDEDRIGKNCCPCCTKLSKLVFEEINSIYAKQKWMVKYFVNKNDAKISTIKSSSLFEMKCPYCGEVFPYKPINLFRFKYLPCNCSDKKSMPNRIAYEYFKSIEKYITNYQTEYSPPWLGNYRYDNYFEYNDNKYVVEMDGSIGHGNLIYGTYEKDVDGLQRDKAKDLLAKQNGITVIRIDCSNNFEYNKMFASLDYEIKQIIDNIHVDENMIMEKASNNLIKEVCLYYSPDKELKYIAEYFHINIGTVIKYLKFGKKYGWCNYSTIYEKRNNNKREAIELWNTKYKYDINNIAEQLHLKPCTIQKYISEGAKDGLCEYDKDIVNAIRAKKSTEKIINKFSKRVYVYDIDNNYLGSYLNACELERNSINDFGIELKSRSIGRVCLGQRKSYKGFIFKYAS